LNSAILLVTFLLFMNMIMIMTRDNIFAIVLCFLYFGFTNRYSFLCFCGYLPLSNPVVSEIDVLKHFELLILVFLRCFNYSILSFVLIFVFDLLLALLMTSGFFEDRYTSFSCHHFSLYGTNSLDYIVSLDGTIAYSAL